MDLLINYLTTTELTVASMDFGMMRRPSRSAAEEISDRHSQLSFSCDLIHRIITNYSSSFWMRPPILGLSCLTIIFKSLLIVVS